MGGRRVGEGGAGDGGEGVVMLEDEVVVRGYGGGRGGGVRDGERAISAEKDGGVCRMNVFL